MKTLPDTKSIGENIRLSRKANGMKAAEAADKLDISESAYTRYERGALSPTADFLGKIATVINAHLVLLLTVPAKQDNSPHAISLYAAADARLTASEEQLPLINKQT